MMRLNSRWSVLALLVADVLASACAVDHVVAVEKLRAVMLSDVQVKQAVLRAAKASGANAIVLQLDGRSDEESEREASVARRIQRTGLDLYYWIEIARCPEVADAHPEWMSSLQGHSEWRRFFKEVPQPKKGVEVVKNYPWVPVLYKEAFEAHRQRVQRLLRGKLAAKGIFLNDLQGAPSACGCGNPLCRWTGDYGPIKTATPLPADAAARFVAAVAKLAPESEIIPVWVTECEEHDGAKDGLCAGVGCFKGICWKAYSKQLAPLAEQSEQLGVLLPFRAFRRDLPRYGAKAGWIRHALRTFQTMPPCHGGKPIAAKRLICVLQGWDVAAAEIEAQKKHASEAGAAGYTHWTPYSRELLYPTLERWFRIPNPKKEYDELIPEEQLLCLTTPAGKQIQTVPLHRLCSQIGAERAEVARAGLGKLSVADRRASLRARWTELLGDVEVASDPVVRKRVEEELSNISVERVQLGTEPGIIVPVLLLVPTVNSPRRVIVAVAQSGKQSFLRHRSQDIAELLDAGTAVCLLDLRGTGETDPGDDRGRRSAATSLSSSELMLGQTLVGARLRDVRQVIRYLRQRDDVDSERIVLWGDSFAPTNTADCNVAVPRGIADRPHHSEPLGGMLALLTALFDEKIEAVYVHAGLSGFHGVLASPFCYVPHDTVIPGVLTSGDLSDVAAAIAPRPLRLNRLVDGSNQRQSVDQMKKEYSTTANSYRQANSARHFSITNVESSIAEWLRTASKPLLKDSTIQRPPYPLR